ncbi:MAG: helix-turn-helix domain-containing protein [Desulfobaccales bacterium]
MTIPIAVVFFIPCGYIFTIQAILGTADWREGGYMFGDFIKAKRREKGLTLREFCKLLKLDASNWSKIERGILSPPQNEKKLEKIAKVLDIPMDSELWKEMRDKASISAGNIPKDILSDKSILNSLPMFFRTVRSEKPSPDELDQLINQIKKERR